MIFWFLSILLLWSLLLAYFYYSLTLSVKWIPVFQHTLHYLWLLFSSSHVQMWELDHKEGSAPRNWYFQIMMLEKTFEHPLHSKEIKPVNPRGNQTWIFIKRTDAEAEASIFWPPDAKNQLTGKDSNAGKDWGEPEKGPIEDETVR